MKVIKEQLEPTKIKLTVIADQGILETAKQAVLKNLSGNVKVAGFRPGKAPANLVEKQIDPARVQSEFLDVAVNELYVNAVQHEKLRPVSQPVIAITKFVPFTTLEFTAEVEAVGDIKVPDYKKIKLAPKKVTTTAKDVEGVIHDLLNRAAQKKGVDRAAKIDDEVTIDFNGVDAQTKEPIEGADGKDYALVLGSHAFIPGFEEALIGLKTGAEKTFVLKFPKNYAAKPLQDRKVSFTVTVQKVQELQIPKLNDTFAASIGPFKSLSELKSDIKRQLTTERQREADQAYDNELLDKIAAKTVVAIPTSLIDEEVNRLEEDEKRNVVYRGQTWQEHLDAENLTAEAHRANQLPAAELRVKSGLILGVVAESEHITTTPEELEIRLMLLKNQYANDEAMQAELEKPEGRREINNRLLIEKTLAKLRDYATKN